ncbi:MAG: hypothetical protein AB7V04_01865 [Desulfomonilaceae bacterium]
MKISVCPKDVCKLRLLARMMFCVVSALVYSVLCPAMAASTDFSLIKSVEILKKPFRISMVIDGPPISIHTRTPKRTNRLELSLQKTRIDDGITDSFTLPTEGLKSVKIFQDQDAAKLIIDFGENPLPVFRVHRSKTNISLTFDHNSKGTLLVSKPVNTRGLSSGNVSEDSNKPSSSETSSKAFKNSHYRLNDKDKKTSPKQSSKSPWENVARTCPNYKDDYSSYPDYEAELERSYGSRRIGRAECIEIDSEPVCFYYEEVFLKYANPKDVVKTIDCMFNMHCPGTGQGGPGGGTEHVTTRFLEQNLSPRTVIRDGKDKAKTLKSTDDRGFDRIEELRLMPLPEFPRRPYETGIDVKSWRMLRDLDRKDPKLAKVVAHAMVWGDEKKRVVFLKDTETRLSQIRKVIKSLDRPCLQILIQGRIVRANKEWGRGLGIQWGGRNNQVGLVKDRAKAYWGFGGNQEGYAPGSVDTPTNRATGTFTDGVNIPSTFAVNLPVAVNNLSKLMGLGLQFGILKPNYITELDFRIQLGESSGLTKILARPEIQVMDGERAIIKNGVVMSLKTSSPNWGTHTELVPVDLKLEVTPKTLYGNKIRMDIDISDNDVDGRSVCDDCEITRLFLTREAHTSLVVGDRETCVLGGIIREVDSGLEQGWPFLMKIPIVGKLFSSSTKAVRSDELLVFLTPTIVRPGSQNVPASDYECLKCEQK